MTPPAVRAAIGSPDGGPWQPEAGPVDAAGLLAHELVTPAHVMGAYLDVLAADAARGVPADAAAVDGLRRQLRRLEALAADLVALRDLDAGTLGVELRQVDLSALARQAAADLAPAVGRRLVVEAAAAVPVTADAARLGQLVAILVTNAARYSPPRRPVTLTVARAGDEATLAVRDHGPGVPEPGRDRLFSRFGRIDPHSPGAGLGLYLAAGIARAHAGRLDYQPARGGGAQFTLRLPRRRPA